MFSSHLLTPFLLMYFLQENVLAESRMMIPDCHKRLEAALADLKATLVIYNIVLRACCTFFLICILILVLIILLCFPKWNEMFKRMTSCKKMKYSRIFLFGTNYCEVTADQVTSPQHFAVRCCLHELDLISTLQSDKSSLQIIKFLSSNIFHSCTSSARPAFFTIKIEL